MPKLIIDLNDEFKVKIENSTDFENSIFSDVYTNAAKNVCEIIKQSANKSNYDAYNNIIAFTGERGRGKSSSMISFRDSLLSDKQKSGFYKRNEFKSLLSNNFSSIDIIDPSLFRGSETLFEIIIAKLFSEFQKRIKQQEDPISHEDKRLIISDFQKVFNNLKVINGDKKSLYEKDSIEALSELAYGSNLSESFKILIENYLKKIFKTNYLVIAIDDFDLNISGAYEMLEDIRQFLIQKNIIILIACKIEQLKASITNVLLKEYSSLVNYEVVENQKKTATVILEGRVPIQYPNISLEKDSRMDFYKGKADKYIEKLFPYSHQLPMPVINNFSNVDKLNNSVDTMETHNQNEIIIYTGKENNLEIDDILKKPDLLREFLIDRKILRGFNLQDLLLELIYSQTQIFISKPTFRNNAIIPDTLREIHNLVGALVLNENPLISFKNYIVDEAVNALPEKLSNILIQLEKQNFNTLNLYLVNLMGDLRESFDVPVRSQTPSINYLLFPKNQDFVSVGDVYSVIKRFYENVRLVKNDLVKFLDYISIYYAIRVRETEILNPTLLKNNLRGGYFNEFNRVFPNQRKGELRRDWVEFNRSVLDDLSEDDKFWIGFFIPYFGNVPQDFRTKKDSPYFRELNSAGAQISLATFSPLTPLSHVLFPDEIWISLFGNNVSPENELYRDIIEWNESNPFQCFLNNIMFYNEFIEILDELSKKQHKAESLKNYSNIIYDYMITSASEAMSVLKNRYPYLDIRLTELFTTHPVYLYWQNRDLIDNKLYKAIDEIFDKTPGADSAYTEEDIRHADNLYNNYMRYFVENPIRSSQGTKQAMNSIVKSFSHNTAIHSRLREIRSLMNINLERGLEEMEQFLKSIK